MSQAEVQVAVTQNDIRSIKKEVEIVSAKVDDVHQALIGSELSKDGGMVQRLKDCETEVEKIRAQVVEIEKNNAKSEQYLKIIWALGGGGITVLLGFLLTHFFH